MRTTTTENHELTPCARRARVASFALAALALVFSSGARASAQEVQAGREQSARVREIQSALRASGLRSREA